MGGRSDECGGWHSGTFEAVASFSYESLVPAGAGTPRYENWVHWLVGEFWCHCHNPTPPLWIPAFAGMTNGGPD